MNHKAIALSLCVALGLECKDPLIPEAQKLADWTKP